MEKIIHTTGTHVRAYENTRQGLNLLRNQVDEDAGVSQTEKYLARVVDHWVVAAQHGFHDLDREAKKLATLIVKDDTSAKKVRILERPAEVA